MKKNEASLSDAINSDPIDRIVFIDNMKYKFISMNYTPTIVPINSPSSFAPDLCDCRKEGNIIARDHDNVVSGN